jgi:hypothetical protein
MANIGNVAADVPGVLSITMPAMAPAFWIRLACYESSEQLTNNTEQKAFFRSYQSLSNQQILCFLWNLKVHYSVHKSPAPVPTNIND